MSAAEFQNCKDFNSFFIRNFTSQLGVNFLTTNKQTTKFSSAGFKKNVKVQSLSYCEFKDKRETSVDLDYEPPHRDLSCLQIQQLLSLVLNFLTTEKQTTKFSSASFQKNLSPSYIIL